MDRGTIQFNVLGPVEAVADGAAVALGGPRQRALLALLLLDPGRPVAAGRLAEELWHGAPPAAAAATLRSYVSRLRRVLGDDLVRAEAGGYALAATAEQVDACRFERLVAAGREASPGQAAERLGAALALWRGPALADVRDEGALAREAQRLDELRLACLEDRMDADLALGRHVQLVPELQTLVREQPLRERLQRQLALALYRAGRQADALEALRAARALLHRELGLEPTAELKELERAILRQEVAAPPHGRATHNLPAPVTSFVGRERELDELASLVRAHRLVTVTGMGGAGKTRLALEVAAAQVDAWANGVWLVDLTAVGAPELVRDAVADTLAPDAELDEHVRRRELLLVLDNCEHVAAACAELVARLLAGAPHVRVLATSRVSLNAVGEQEYALDPLDTATAVRLFHDRAAAVRRTVADEPAIEEVCRELDGLPLAIELAAARAKALSPAEIAERLDDRLRFLRAWRRVGDPRHRTLETLMDWSYDLLDDEAKRLLRRLSVFAGGATLAAVADICLEGDEHDALDELGRLLDASLVRAQTGAPTRYVLLETVRQYAASKFDEEPVRRRHATHYLALARRANLSIEALGSPQQPELVLPEQHNLRAALDWAATADVELALELMLALENFWITQALAEGARRYADLLPRTDGLDAGLRAGALRDYGACLDVLQRFDEAWAAYAESRALLEQAGDELGVAALDFRLGNVAALRQQQAKARMLFTRSLETFRRHGDAIGEIQALGNLGALEMDVGDFARGRAMVGQVLELAHETGWAWWEARARGALAARLVCRGELEEAEQLAHAYLAFAAETANRQETLHGIALHARIAAARGDGDRAVALWSAVEATDDGPGRFGRFDRAEYAAAMPAGRVGEPLALDDAVRLALAT